MNNSMQVLVDRVKRDYQYQFRNWKSVLDWTVMLYFVVPAVIAAIVIYRSWWLELPVWGSFLSISVIASILYVVAWMGVYRMFVQEADGIFYLKHREAFIFMKKWAYLYAVIKTMLSTTLSIVLLLPFLLNSAALEILDIVFLLFYFIGLTLFVQSLHIRIRFTYSGWKQKLWLVLLFIILFFGNLSLFMLGVQAFLIGILAILLTVFSLTLVRPIVLTTGFFQEEYLLENEQRLRFVSGILGASPSVENPKIIKRKKPWMFRGKMFKKRNAQNGFIELFLKISLRNSTYIGGYFRLIAVTSAAIFILPPLVLKLAIYFGFCFFISIWIGGVWDEIIFTNPIGKRYGNSDDFYRVRKKVGLLLTLFTAGVLLIALLISMLVFTNS